MKVGGGGVSLYLVFIKKLNICFLFILETARLPIHRHETIKFT